MSERMPEPTTMSAAKLSGWHKQHNCPRARISCDKDACFEPVQEAEGHRVAFTNGRLKLAKDRRLGLRVSVIWFLAALVLLLVATPFVQGLSRCPLYEAVLYTLVMCTGLIASGSRRRLTFPAVSLALAAIWLNQLWPAKCPALTFILPAMVFLGLVIVSLLRFILRAKAVDANALCAGISVYLILGLVWGLAYTLAAQLDHHAFAFSTHPGTVSTMSGFTSIYFSFTTLATLGYGDITPATDLSRMLAMLEAMTGTLFVGVMIARLVSLYSGAKHGHTPAHSEIENNNK